MSTDEITLENLMLRYPAGVAEHIMAEIAKAERLSALRGNTDGAEPKSKDEVQAA